jgi:hypothetical protein
MSTLARAWQRSPVAPVGLAASGDTLGEIARHASVVTPKVPLRDKWRWREWSKRAEIGRPPAVVSTGCNVRFGCAPPFHGARQSRTIAK